MVFGELSSLEKKQGIPIKRKYLGWIAVGLLFGLAVQSVAADRDSTSDLSSQFQNPPASARPWVYWFWLNGNITREGITADIEAMHRVGIGGVLIMEVDQGVPLGPVPFAGPKWRELFQHVVAEASRLGIEVDMNNDAGWHGSGGPWVTPEHATKKVVWTETAVEGSRRFEDALPQPQAVGNYYRDIAVLAFPTPNADADTKKRVRIDNIESKTALVREMVKPRAQYPAAAADAVVARAGVLDLTAKLDDKGRMAWDAPAGKWTVLRIGHTLIGVVNGPSPKSGQGLECDKLSREAFDTHWAGLMGKLIADVGPEAGKTLAYTHIDSWESGSQNWTPKMRKEFQRRRGYDMTPWLPALTGRVVGSLEASERFLWDFRKTIAELNNDNYAGRAAELAHQYGMKLSIEAYGSGMFDDLSYAGRADSPMGEFWIGGGSMETLKAMASAGHVYGKNVIGAEAFTAVTEVAKWMNTPYSIKSLGDTAFCEGINRFVFHRYAMQPWLNRVPGMTMGPWGIHYERTETWWEQTRPWHEYRAVGETDVYFVANSRSQAVDAVCTFRVKGKRPEFWHPDTGRIEPVVVYEQIDGATRMPIHFDPSGSVFVVFRPDADAALDPVVALSRDGTSLLEKNNADSPKIVVQKAVYGVPGDAARTRDVTAKTQRLVDQRQCDFQVSRMAEGDDPALGVVKTLTVDFTIEGKPRRASATDPQWIELAGESVPRDAEVRCADGGRLMIEVSKPGRYELKTASGKTAAVDVPALPKPIDIAGPWELRFPAGWDAPKSVALDKLISWSEHPNAGVKYFSGTATYAINLRVPDDMISKNRRVYLDLGDVQVLAQVKLNGRDLGIAWKTPFRLDVTDAVRAGDNALEVRVTNNWVNRLIGDEQLPEDSRRHPGGNLVEWPQWLLENKPSPTGRHTFSTWRHWKKDSPLMESGLLGPVTISATQCVEPAM